MLKVIFLAMSYKGITVWPMLCSFLLLAVSLSACSRRPDLDTSLLNDKPCAAPCWHNIVPGVSSKDDVHNQLSDSAFIKEGSLNYSTTEEAGVPLGVFSWQSRGQGRNWIYLRDGKVLCIIIQLDYQLTLGEIVNKYGPPETVYAILMKTGDLRYGVSVNYPARGLQFSTSTLRSFDPADVEAEKSVVLSEDVVMTEVTYFAPTSLRDMFSEVFLLPQDAVEYRIANSQKWEGFGRVELAK